MVWPAVANYPTLLGVAPGSALATIFPAVYMPWRPHGHRLATVLTLVRPAAYGKIGLGHDASL